jgi:hypothetical protein
MRPLKGKSSRRITKLETGIAAKKHKRHKWELPRKPYLFLCALCFFVALSVFT